MTRKLTLLLLFATIFLIYFWNTPSDYSKSLKQSTYKNLLTSSDTVPNTFLPYLLYKHHSFDFSPISFYFRPFDGGNKKQYFITVTDQGKYSSYPVLTGIMALPVYLPALMLNKVASFDYYENLVKVLLLGRVTAIFYSCLAVVLFYLILEKIGADIKDRLLFTAFFAFGTTMWSIASRSLWMHTIMVPFVCATIFLLLTNYQRKYLFVGSFCGLMVLARPTSFVFCLIMALYVLKTDRKRMLPFLFGAIPPILCIFLYNWAVFSNPFVEGYSNRGDLKWTTPLLQGIISNIITPGKGILFISPPLMLSFWAVSKSFTDRGFGRSNNLLYRFLSVIFVGYFLMYSKWYAWHGGNSFGYRFLTDILPIMVLFCYQAYIHIKSKALKIVMLILMLYSIYPQWNIVFYGKSRCEDEDMHSFECLRPRVLDRYVR